MSQKTNLANLIDEIIDEADKQNASYESEIKRVRRGFMKLLDILGGDINDLKTDGKYITFEESEIPFMKAILKMIYKKKSLLQKLHIKT